MSRACHNHCMDILTFKVPMDTGQSSQSGSDSFPQDNANVFSRESNVASDPGLGAESDFKHSIHSRSCLDASWWRDEHDVETSKKSKSFSLIRRQGSLPPGTLETIRDLRNQTDAPHCEYESDGPIATAITRHHSAAGAKVEWLHFVYEFKRRRPPQGMNSSSNNLDRRHHSPTQIALSKARHHAFHFTRTSRTS